ncbi:DNA-binding protein [Sphingobacterium alkalisoli]|uniref:DNA-binding protein n=1 Tax=Sphingobacterium alkalisoli TaxID=1874115 RepID=A0A4U0H9A2_9SPHI|nr:glycosyl hydrolase [Sphingobacterium alkalisoli]TJY67954.1 DNA-binding protein [Sphingobacterium alkalisoli]GGH10127.1 DNA-binding protein [Sphingobacterium alkalisoli]
MNLKIFIVLFIIAVAGNSHAQINGIPPSIVPLSANSYQEAKPWVVWYFMHASYSKEGIKADLEAMAANNIAGAYFTPIKAQTDPPLFTPSAESLTPEWWEMFRYLVGEAKKHNIQIAMFPNDGFATAGGPWITPEKSMQKVVSADTILHIVGEGTMKFRMPQPERLHDYYRDIQLFAIPLTKHFRVSNSEAVKVSASYDENLDRLALKDNAERFSSSQPGWIQYEFTTPFPCNAIKIQRKANNYGANRFKVLVSDDGKHFSELTRLESPRTGWLDWDNGVTHTIPYTRAKYFRFVFDPAGFEPGAEDLDAAKWKPSINILGITLMEEARVNQFEGKTGEIWRVSLPTTAADVGPGSIVSRKDVVRLQPVGHGDTVELDLGPGAWRILRIGHTTTGHKNETAGAGKGLECDKLDAEIVAFQFEQWYGKAKKSVSPELSDDVLTVFHIDSWESGSQNWTKQMPSEFLKRRGYDMTAYLPVLSGFVVDNVDASEAFLHDYRETIAELLQERGFETLRQMCDKYGVEFTAETTAPIMTGDGLSHFKFTDRTMGEFWFRSPSHDKPNDVYDAISGGHIYGKNIIMCEAFTQIRMEWDEHPRLLKSLQDRNYALGVNNLAYHVYVHNPWMDRKPGMTLDGVGTYFQRDQTWWKPGRAWVNYAIRTQQLLQHGKPVRDIAVFIGEEVPRRSILPDRLVQTLPGIIGNLRVKRTDSLLRNEGQPMQKIAAVNTSANMYNPVDWVDPLRGYSYDSFNPDVLLKNAKVVDGKVILSDHIAYSLLVIPGEHLLNPNPTHYSLAVLEKFKALIEQGATVLFHEKPAALHGHLSATDSVAFRDIVNELFGNMQTAGALAVKAVGLGKVYVGVYTADNLAGLGIEEDVVINAKKNHTVAWNHRRFEGGDTYFFSNQDSAFHAATFSVRAQASQAYVYDAVQDRLASLAFSKEDGRIKFTLPFDAYQSCFVIFSDHKISLAEWKENRVSNLKGPWTVRLADVQHDPIIQQEPNLWTRSSEDDVRYHSGMGSYSLTFDQHREVGKQRVVLQLDQLENLAEVMLNGNMVGVIWTKPYEIDVTDYLKKGENKLDIKVYNTWGNRFGYESSKDTAEKIVKTTATPKFLKGLQPAGLKGEVKLRWFKRK